jgi:transcriptional regulator with XRE-family HTH domain
MTPIELLKKRVDVSSQAQVARELGLSKTTVSQLLSGHYGASTEKLESKIMIIYGNAKGVFTCPHTLDEITPLDCAITWERAKAAGRRIPGNPVTLRQYHACRNCEIRK